MLPMCISFQDLFCGKNSLKLAKYWISYGTMCHMALSGLKGLKKYSTVACDHIKALYIFACIFTLTRVSPLQLIQKFVKK